MSGLRTKNLGGGLGIVFDFRTLLGKDRENDSPGFKRYYTMRERRYSLFTLNKINMNIKTTRNVMSRNEDFSSSGIS